MLKRNPKVQATRYDHRISLSLTSRGVTVFTLVLGFLLGSSASRADTPAQEAPSLHPIYPVTPLTAEGLEHLKPLLEMDENALLALVPPQGGLFFVSCPNCNQGAQDTQIEWTPELGDKVRCKFCGQTYPSEKYPYNGHIDVKTPTGKIQTFRYYEDAEGNKYFMEARRWYAQRDYMQNTAQQMATLYASDPVKYAEAGRRSALILKRFADTYPDYIARFDYPGRPKQFFPDGFPAKLTPYRASKWYWWGYGDISRELLYSYDILKDSPFLTTTDKTHIEKDLFQSMLDWVGHNDGTPLGNMHPMLWTSRAIASHVLGKPELEAGVKRDIRQFISEGFLYDGMWHEGSTAYHLQTTKGLRAVINTLYPGLSDAQAEAAISRELPELKQSEDALMSLRLPNGRYAPIKDAWADLSSDMPLAASHPVLLPGLGYAILGLGTGKTQLQAHLGFTGRFGHDQYDSLSLLLFGQGNEVYSDLGYSHSLARAWTLSTAAHNTVIIDQKSQDGGEGTPTKSQGNVRLYDAADDDFQVVEADALDAYPGLAKTYRRALVAVRAPDSTEYVVDVFDVAGGNRHDWILHGSADESQTLALSAPGHPLKLANVASLLPTGMKWEAPKSEGAEYLKKSLQDAWSYGFFRDARATNEDGTVVATFRNSTRPQKGSQTWLLGMTGSRYTQAQSWALRNIQQGKLENESKLDERYRQDLIVTRQGASNRFVAVHCPFDGTIPIKNVAAIPLEPNGVALKVERAKGIDYILFASDARPRTGHDGKLAFSFDGRAAVAHIGGARPILKMIGGTYFTCGTEKITAKTSEVWADLQDVKGNQFKIEGNIACKPGAVFIVKHGDNRTTAFHIKVVQHQNGSTVLETEEPGVFSGEASGTLTLKPYPQSSYPAPHSVYIVSDARSRQ